jgi:hypothetical protein
MAKAYKVTSDPFFVNGNVTESAGNTYTQQEISLPLDSLNQEGVLVHAVYFTGSEPDRVAGLSSFLDFQVTATSKTATGAARTGLTARLNQQMPPVSTSRANARTN